MFRYLVHLEVQGDPAWECLVNMQKWLLRLMHRCQTEHIDKGQSIIFCVSQLFLLLLHPEFRRSYLYYTILYYTDHIYMQNQMLYEVHRDTGTSIWVLCVC